MACNHETGTDGLLEILGNIGEFIIILDMLLDLLQEFLSFVIGDVVAVDFLIVVDLLELDGLLQQLLVEFAWASLCCHFGAVEHFLAFLHVAVKHTDAIRKELVGCGFVVVGGFHFLFHFLRAVFHELCIAREQTQVSHAAFYGTNCQDGM